VDYVCLAKDRQRRPFGKLKLRYKPKETACTSGCLLHQISRRNYSSETQSRRPKATSSAERSLARILDLGMPYYITHYYSLFVHKFIYGDLKKKEHPGRQFTMSVILSTQYSGVLK